MNVLFLNDVLQTMSRGIKWIRRFFVFSLVLLENKHQKVPEGSRNFVFPTWERCRAQNWCKPARESVRMLDNSFLFLDEE